MTVKKPDMIEKFIPKNKYSRPGTKRKKTTKIAWHYTGQAEVKAINTVKYFTNVVGSGYKVNGKNIYASSHFVVGLDGEIYYIVPVGEVAYTTNQANSYSIGVECATTGKDDHYTDAEYKAMVKLGAWLATEYNLDPREDFIRHYDVTGKICPRYFVNNKKAWEQFKLDCYNAMHTAQIKNNVDYNSKAKVVCDKALNVRKARPEGNKLAEVIDSITDSTIVTLGYVINNWGSIYYLKDGVIRSGFVNVKYLELL